MNIFVMKRERQVFYRDCSIFPGKNRYLNKNALGMKIFPDKYSTFIYFNKTNEYFSEVLSVIDTGAEFQGL